MIRNASSPCPGGAEFALTSWSRVLRAGQRDERALESLCRSYWPPLYACVRRDGHSPEDARDIVQGFIAHLLERNDFATVSPERGKFRSFLLRALRNFTIDQVRAASAQKRGGGASAVNFEINDAEEVCAPQLTDTLSPDRAFDRQWARTVMARALERLREEHRTPEQAARYAALEPSLSDGGRIKNQAEIAAGLGVSPGALAVAATRLRHRLRRLIEAEVAETLSDSGDLEEEMRALRDVWSA